MSKYCIYAMVIAAFLLGSGRAAANDIYIAQNASGAGNGVNCNNAYASAFFNSNGNWGSGANKIGPGTTVHLCGTFTAPAPGTTQLTFQGSGANGSPVTVLFEENARLSSPAWGAQGAINLGKRSYLVIDGGKNGIIENTANGSRLAFQQVSNLIALPSMGGPGISNIEIRNLTLKNNYVHEANFQPDGHAVVSSASISILGAGSDIFIHHNTITECGRACILVVGGRGVGSNWQVYNNVAREACWNICLNNTNGQTHKILLHDNDVVDNDHYWSDNDQFHTDPIFLYGNPRTGSPGMYGDAYIYNNHIHGALALATGFIFLSKQMDAPTYVFNNVFQPTSTYSNSEHPNFSCNGNGWIAMPWDHTGPVTIFNNTFDSRIACGKISSRYSGKVTGSRATSLDFRNNILYDISGHDIKSGTVTSDYNVWWGIDGFSRQAFKVESPSVNYYSFGQWRNSGYDQHSTTADPNLSPTGQLGPGSSAVGLGTNLTSLCASDVNLAPLCKDKAGKPRPATGNWDAGAYNLEVATAAPVPAVHKPKKKH